MILNLINHAAENYVLKTIDNGLNSSLLTFRHQEIFRFVFSKLFRCAKTFQGVFDSTDHDRPLPIVIIIIFLPQKDKRFQLPVIGEMIMTSLGVY